MLERVAGLRHLYHRLHEAWLLANLRRSHRGFQLGAHHRLEHGLLWRLSQGAVLQIGSHCHLRHHTELKVEGRLTLGHHVHVGPFSILSAMQEIVIGDDCLLAERVSIRDHDHRIGPPDTPYRASGYVVQPVQLGRNVWVGAGVSILKGVQLGDHCIVGAHAVVTRSFPAGSVIAGVPARLLRSLPTAH